MPRARWIAAAGILVCALGWLAIADGDATWDGTYARHSGGGNELCPDASATVVVSGAKFSIPWNIKLGNTVFRVGRIAGSVRANGSAVFTATLDLLSAEVLDKLHAIGDSPEQLQKIATAMRLSFVAKDKRNLELSSGNCYAGWDAPAGAAAPVTAPAKPATPAKDKGSSTATGQGSGSGASSTPSKKIPNGGSCTSDSACASGWCTADGCARHSKCSSDSQCASHWCTADGCARRNPSKPALGSGMECYINSDCASGSCKHDRCS